MGAGEWLFGPIVTARYGGMVMWLATISIALQVVFNLAVMRYALYSGEPIFVGFLRTAPGPTFWIIFYLIADSGHIWPYTASNAAVPLAAALLGHLPGPLDDALVRNLGYAIFLAAFVPLIFGGKIYNAVERLMVVKVFSVLGYLLVIDLVLVSGRTWLGDIQRVSQIRLPSSRRDRLGDFGRVRSRGRRRGLGEHYVLELRQRQGLGNGAARGRHPEPRARQKDFPFAHGKGFSYYRTEPRALARLAAAHSSGSAVGLGSRLAAWHGASLPCFRWSSFAARTCEGHAAAAMTARGIADRHGEIFWFSTLLCGFYRFRSLASRRVLDSIVRRWTDVLWSASGNLRSWEGRQVKNIYYFVLLGYCLWGLLALRLTAQSSNPGHHQQRRRQHRPGDGGAPHPLRESPADAERASSAVVPPNRAGCGLRFLLRNLRIRPLSAPGKCHAVEWVILSMGTDRELNDYTPKNP